MTPSIYKVATIGSGLLYVMPKPSNEHLSEDAEYLASMGVNIVVSHLEAAESERLGLAAEGQIMEAAGIEFVSFPIRDHRLPKDQEFFELVRNLYRALLQGKNIAIHCRAGIGRTGVTAACILLEDGYSRNDAIDTVSTARNHSIPDTNEQREFINRFERIKLKQLMLENSFQ